MSDRRQRLFVAVPLPEAVLSTVERAQSSLPQVPGLRLLRPEQLHVTLAFIGQVGDDKALAARSVLLRLRQRPGGEGRISGFLLVPSPRKARVIALAIEDLDGMFATLFEEVMSGLESAGVMQREKRPFRPHLTIARLRDPGPVVPKSECEQVPLPVESVCLYRSELKREGAQYTVVERVTFERRS